MLQCICTLESCWKRETAKNHRTNMHWSIWKRILYSIALRDKNIYYKGSWKRQQFSVSGGKRFWSGKTTCFLFFHQPAIWPWTRCLYLCFLLFFVCLVKLDGVLSKAGPTCCSVIVKRPALVVSDLGWKCVGGVLIWMNNNNGVFGYGVFG